MKHLIERISKLNIAWGLSLIGGLFPTICCAQQTISEAKSSLKTPTTQMEVLDRGLVALPATNQGIFLSWRLLGTDKPTVCFDIKRDNKTIAHNIRITNYTDPEGTTDNHYQIIVHQEKNTSQHYKEETQTATPWKDLYKSLPIDRPQGGTTPDGHTYTYSPNDCSVGDVDGDGEYELIVKWDPSNSHDNSHNGYSGEVYLDCYKLNGKKLWRINLGKNIRAGAHYTQFLVYDLDGDGKAEMVCKTAPGSKDGKGAYISDAATDEGIKKIDNTADYRNSSGRIMDGPELLTIFEGYTGKALHTIWYNPNRGFGYGGSAKYASEWGDKGNYGNRGERYLAAVAYLDGTAHKPSAIMCRGYYTRSYIWAVDFDGKKLHTKWLHASTSPHDWTISNAKGEITQEAHNLKKITSDGEEISATAFGQGAHSLSIGDVDGDSCDEIIYGSAAIDHDGTLLYSTGLGHGDAQHLGDFNPDRPGLEYFMVHEDKPYGSDFRDAATGEILQRTFDRDDTGRGLIADIDANYRGCEMWSLDTPGVRTINGKQIGNAKEKGRLKWPAMNFRIYWDGDLQEELLANGRPPHFPPYLQKWDGEKVVSLPLSNGKQLYEMGHSVSNNWSKATPNLQADILGDWREELIFWDESDASHLNIFTTNTPTPYRVPTLMHDHVYRMGIVWQNVGYNQPPHLGYYLPDVAEKITE